MKLGTVTKKDAREIAKAILRIRRPTTHNSPTEGKDDGREAL
jgi:hypothetical protein